MGVVTPSGEALEWRGGHETIRIEPWGRNSLRVRGTVWQHIRDDQPGALLPPAPSRAELEISEGLARITNGGVTAEISESGRLRFLRAADGRELLAEPVPHFSRRRRRAGTRRPAGCIRSSCCSRPAAGSAVMGWASTSTAVGLLVHRR